jgi:hypothetical protein
MVKSFLANFLELGMSGTGAYALSDDLSDFFLGGIKHIAQIPASGINKRLVPSLMQMNRPGVPYPILKVSGIDDKAGKELADMLSALADKKYITPDDPLEDHLRKRIGLPARSLEGQRQVQPSPAYAPAPTLAERIMLAERRRRG